MGDIGDVSFGGDFGDTGIGNTGGFGSGLGEGIGLGMSSLGNPGADLSSFDFMNNGLGFDGNFSDTGFGNTGGFGSGLSEGVGLGLGDMSGITGNPSSGFGIPPGLLMSLLGKMGLPPPVMAALNIGKNGFNNQTMGQNLQSGLLGLVAAVNPGLAAALGIGSAVTGIGLGNAIGGIPGMSPGAIGAANAGIASPGNAAGGRMGGGWGDILSGGLGLYNAMKLARMGAPTAGQNGANAQIASLMANPSSISSMPGYKAGEQAVLRSGAANGYLGSGNMMAALKDFGGDFYNKTLQTMGSLGQPMPGQTESTIGGMQLEGQALNRLLYGVGGLGGGGGPGG